MVANLFILLVSRIPQIRHFYYGKKLHKSMQVQSLINSWIRFLLQTTFDLLMIALVTVVPGEYPNLLQMEYDWTSTDIVILAYTAIILLVLLVFMILVPVIIVSSVLPYY